MKIRALLKKACYFYFYVYLLKLHKLTLGRERPVCVHKES